MPYNSTADLPARIKKMPAKRRRQWMHVWNSTYNRTKDEGRAFAAANSVVSGRKELDLAFKATSVRMFTGADDTDLPDHIKSLPMMTRMRWVNNYHWCLQECQDSDEAEMMADKQTMMSIDEMMDMKMSTKERQAPAASTEGDDDDGEEVEEGVEPADGENEQGAKAELTAKKRNKLPKGSFAYVDESGKGHLPIHDAAHVRNALARMNQTDMPASAKAAAMHKIKAAAKRHGVKVGSKDLVGPNSTVHDIPPVLPWFARLKAWVTGEPVVPQAGATNLQMFGIKEGPDGRLRALLVYSNIFKDKEGETFSEAAHKEYEEAVDAGQAPYPELHLWHGGPESRWGVVETIAYIDGFAVAGGVVDPGKEHVALKMKELADKGEIAVSHGYIGLRGPEGVYELYRPFEISPLPVGSEANPWTTTNIAVNAKESDMAWSDKKKAWFKQHLGWDDAKLASAEAKFGEMTQALKSAGVEWKEWGETPAPTPPSPPPVPPAPTPPPAPGPTPPPAQGAQGAQADDGIGPLGEIVSAVKSIAECVTGLQKEVAALKEQDGKTVEQRANEQVLAKIANSTNGGFSPATSRTNVQPGMKEAEDDWFAGILGNVIGNPQPAGAGAAITHANGNNGEVK